MRYRDMGNRQLMDKDYPIQRQCYACDEVGHKFFVKDAENPYTTDRKSTRLNSSH